MNKLYIGDNLTIMRTLPDSSVDLVATDPPFFSQRNYTDFDDRWDTLEDYLEFMSVRCVEMHRLLKDTGSLYLHCDTTASHYLKVELDKIFGRKNFRNELVWAYNKRANNSKNVFQKTHDVILFYCKTDKAELNPLFKPVMTMGMKKNRERGYTRQTSKIDGTKTLVIYDKNTKGSQRQINSGEYSEEEIKYVPDVNKLPRETDVWTDLPVLASTAHERMDYRTQKPRSVYERIVKASSERGQLVLDPFAGSGTTLDAAEAMGRNYIGIDQNEEAVTIIKNRLERNYGMFLSPYEVFYEQDLLRR